MADKTASKRSNEDENSENDEGESGDEMIGPLPVPEKKPKKRKGLHCSANYNQ